MQIYSYFPVCLNTTDILFCFNFCMLCFQCVLYTPLNCMADGNVEAMMGTHWIDTTASEYHGTPFTHAYNYGFYHTKMTFIEALSSKAFLNSKATYTGVIKQPSAYSKSGYYPSSYSISYDAITQDYTYSLDNLKSY